MVRENTTASIVLDKRTKKKNGTYPVKLRITHNRDSRKYNTGYSLTETDFNKVMQKNPRGQHGELKAELEALRKHAEGIIKNMKVFSFDEFYPRYTGKGGEPAQVYPGFASYVDDLKREERIGTAITYQCAMNSLKEFHPNEKLYFKNVDVAFVKRYANWMTKTKGNSNTTVGIYLRCLRTLYNKAIRSGYVNQECYPFGNSKHGKFHIPSSQNIKKALSLKDIEKIFKYHPRSERESLNRDVWIFSYLTNGANIKDICLLKYKDINNGRIVFRRAKTSGSDKKNKPIIAVKTPQIAEIIERWGNKPRPEKHVFPFLSGSETPEQIKQKTSNLVRSINQSLKRIARDLDIDANISTYTARHSFATILKRSGVPVAYISDALGHADLKTTENYLSGFEDDAMMDIAQNLTNFDGVNK